MLIAPLWLFCRRRTFVNPGVLVGLTFSVFLLSFIAGQFLPGLRTFQKDLVTIPVSGANTQFPAMISAVRGGLKFSNSFSAEEILKNESYELRSLSKASAEDNWRLDKADDTQIEHILSGARCLADGAASFPWKKLAPVSPCRNSKNTRVTSTNSFPQPDAPTKPTKRRAKKLVNPRPTNSIYSDLRQSRASLGHFEKQLHERNYCLGKNCIN